MYAYIPEPKTSSACNITSVSDCRSHTLHALRISAADGSTSLTMTASCQATRSCRAQLFRSSHTLATSPLLCLPPFDAFELSCLRSHCCSHTCDQYHVSCCSIVEAELNNMLNTWPVAGVKCSSLCDSAGQLVTTTSHAAYTTVGKKPTSLQKQDVFMLQSIRCAGTHLNML